MLDVTTPAETKIGEVGQTVHDQKAPRPAKLWETPKLEDVSEQVMAQPYIRFT
jgi:hypothetical protein